MESPLEAARRRVNLTRYASGQRTGHYESFFLRANHPSRPLAFWIRYTLFSPHQHPEQAIGELWAIYFDDEAHSHVAVKQEVPLTRCRFSASEFSVQVDEAQLGPGRLSGAASSGDHTVSWELAFRGDAPPLFLLPLSLYDTKLPKAKSLVSLPLAAFRGTLIVDGRSIEVADWIGTQNHNWGSKHTDFYTWGQVAGFDTHPESFLEVATAQLKIGPLWTPRLTPLVLRHRGTEIALNCIRQCLRAGGSFTYFTWRFRSETDAIRIEGSIEAPRQAFVGLNYYNPPGGSKHCLNSKLAACELRVTDKRAGGAVEVLSTAHRAAFEILTDDRSHGVEIVARGSGLEG